MNGYALSTLLSGITELIDRMKSKRLFALKNLYVMNVIFQNIVIIIIIDEIITTILFLDVMQNRIIIGYSFAN